MKEEIQALHTEFKEHFIERDEEILGAILAILANENVLYLGPPGTAKTYLAQNICKSIDGAQFFYYLLTRFTTPEEIFGPLSIKSLEKDEFKRKTDGCLPTSHIALLDEIFKANSSILNSLLTILNERRFHNGTEVIDTPLLTVFGASNELPEEDENLEALYDRFLFRYDVRYIQNEDNVKSLLFSNNGEFSPKVKLNVEEIKKIRAHAQSVELSEEVQDIILSLKRDLERKESDDTESIRISDRRWKKIVNVLKVAAAANGRKKVDRTMLILLQHMLWDVPDQKAALRTLIIQRLVTGGIDSEKLENDVKSFKNLVDSETEILSDENFPVTVYYVDRSGYPNGNFKNYPELRDYHNRNKKTKFTLDRNYYQDGEDFEKIIEKLKKEHAYSPIEGINADKRILYQKEFQSLEEKYIRQRRSVKDKFDQVKKNLEANIWITPHDKDEISHVQQQKLNQIYNLEKSLDLVRGSFNNFSSTQQKDVETTTDERSKTLSIRGR
ncbi:AAA family ATPase [Methanoregula sp.]|uniref:AAA family ATPase n=1 Tax=Methanoregula sp. TaxID=2052170 RepID=UPI00260AA77F|nr:AAA family ATPase [Methanoregula sp.]MDD5142395.1 AAA family ATPase [Methanoregula sp.]